MYKVFKASDFDKKSQKILSKKEQVELENFILKLKEWTVSGKPLSYIFFREKKIAGKRIYFLVYEEIKIILLVSISTKKYQQETIDKIKLMLPYFSDYIQKLR